MKTLKAIGTILLIAFWAWIIISYVQIVLFNCSDDPFSHYSAWNLFILFFK